MNASDFAALRTGGWVVVNRDGSTYNSAQMQACVYMAAVGLALYFKWSRAQRPAPRQLTLFDLKEAA